MKEDNYILLILLLIVGGVLIMGVGMIVDSPYVVLLGLSIFAVGFGHPIYDNFKHHRSPP